MTIHINDDKYLAHYGILRKSGRYPWGSGANPSQRSKSFIDQLANLREQGMSDTDIAKGFGMSLRELRETNTIARNAKKASDIAYATRLKEKGYSNVAIGNKMSINESSVRSLLADGQKDKLDILTHTSNMLRDEAAKGGYLDIGKGVENQLQISKEKLGSAVAVLKDEGYVVHKVQVDQLGTGQKTTVKVLAPKGTTYKDIVTNMNQIRQINQKSEDGGRTFYGMLPPKSIDQKRVKIIYDEDGGSLADGVMYVRPGKEDLSLGGSHYAQVRVMVDGTHYLKGMAIYKDDLPPGVDVAFNTNKKRSEIGINKLDAMKKISDDPDNPFGAIVDQIGPKDPITGRPLEVTSAMNIVNKEGDWEGWKSSIASQVLSKQSPKLAEKQLDIAYQRKKTELDEIMALTNPAVKAKLLQSYADAADSASVHLKAAELPRQRAQVILPLTKIKENEVFAPNFNDGERVALIRYPHGGTFEIPELTVNNRIPEGKALIGKAARDAIGIHANTADRLSGADFDGDTVLVIPNNAGKLKTTPALEGLKKFDTKTDYPPYDGMKTIDGGIYNAKTKEVDYGPNGPSSHSKQHQMGEVSNLITDMTIQGANTVELAAAVRHSMVVIDAEKHHLNYKESAKANGIAALKKKYQPRPDGRPGGASTLISRATSRTDVLARRPRSAARGGPVDKATGKKVFDNTNESWVDSKGRTVFKTQRSVKLRETDDAHSLSSGTKIESVYADHSNRMKALANAARREQVNLPSIRYSPSAKEAYLPQVQSLNAKLNIALKNSPLERQAQLAANATVSTKRAANPNMDGTQLKKISAQALAESRVRYNARKIPVDITPDEWHAIQAGAISHHKLKQILDNTDISKVKTLATPRVNIKMSGANLAKAKSMIAAGRTQAEVAAALGVSLTTVKEGLKNG